MTDWDYWASIRTIEDHEGIAFDAVEEAKYWTVKTGFWETTIDATHGGASSSTITLLTDQTTAVEGGEVIFKLTRVNGPIGQAV